MDSVTHAALGAIVGEAVAGKALGKRALVIGAVAQNIPDIDFLASFWLSPADNLMAHRGFTHSILFCALISLILAQVARRTYPAQPFSYWPWTLFIGLEILLHLLLDACNAYGVGWLEPFSDKRFSFHVLFVVDPFYSIWLGISLIALISLRSENRARKFWTWFGIVASTVYFLYAVYNKILISRKTQFALNSQHLMHKRFFSTPSPLNCWVWYVVVESDTVFHTSYVSVHDKIHDTMEFIPFAKRSELLEPLGTSHQVQQLKKFSQDYFTVHQKEDTLIFNDLRFGQIAGWENPRADFVFQYYVNYPEANLLVIQRGRFSEWNRKTFSSMIDRIEGHQ